MWLNPEVGRRGSEGAQSGAQRPGASGEPWVPDHEPFWHVPPEAVVQDNLVFFSKSLRTLMKSLVWKLSYCNEEKEKGYFTS